MEPVLGQGEGELASRFERADEVNAMPQFRAGDAHADGEVGLADAGLGLAVEVGQPLLRGELRRHSGLPPKIPTTPKRQNLRSQYNR